MPEIRYARNGDVEIAYETFGDPATGDPLLLVMGLDFQMVWWPDGFCQALADAGFAVTRFDNRDTGLSTKFASPARRNPFQALLGGVRPAYSSLDLVADTLAVMDAAGARSAHVVGASMGAAIAQLVALTHSDRTRSLTSIMGLPLDASGPRIMTRYLSLGVFGQFRHLPKGDDPASRVETLVAISPEGDKVYIGTAGSEEKCALAREHLFDPYFTRHAAVEQKAPLPWPKPYGMARNTMLLRRS